MASTPSWRPPEEFDEYRIVRALGAGAMGQVFLAHDTLLDRPVAVKFLGAGEISSASRERFLIEARALARLQHPNVVTVYRVGELGRRPYLVSEFIQGESLDRIAKPVPWRRVCELAIGLARGLAAAHRRGVLHRDIKPANTIVAAGDAEVKLLDFGLAKLIDTDGTRSRGGSSTSMPVIRRSAILTPPVGVKAIDAFDATQDPEVARVATPETDTLATGSQSGDPAVELPGAPSSPSLTRAGAVMGTPYYMAPETWRGEGATTRSDVYSLGVLLYELVVGAPPHREVAVGDLPRAVQDVPAQPLTAVAPEVDPRFAAIVDRCLRRDPAKRYASAEELREALESLTASRPASASLPAGNPYRGLRTFEAEHRALFFGRGPEIRAVLERLRTDAFVLVAGDSGVGKSSLCRAGVVPAILEGALGGNRSWRSAALVPGRRPAVALSAELARVLDLDEVVFERDLVGGDPAAIATHRRTILRALGSDRGLLLVIDQLEELVTIADRAEAAATAELLTDLMASAGRGVRLLATVRGDFLTRAASLPSLGDEMPRALYLLRAMNTDGIREAIVGPARAKGVRFEPEAMVDELVEAAAQTPGSLPLLQFALAELWEARPSGAETITAAALAGIGGVEGALARHADQVVEGMLPAERAAARRLLVSLVSADGTRARRTRAELVGDDRAAGAALEGLVRGRLISVREGEGAPGYELAHETLLTHWDALRGWLDDDGELRIARRRIEAAAAEWERLGKSRELLWGPRQLAEVARLDAATIAPIGRALLEASHRAWRARRWRRTLLIAAVPALVLAVAIIIRVRVDAADRERRAAAAAERDRKVGEHTAAAAALQREVDAGRRALDAARAEAFQRFDAVDLPAGEARWAEAQKLAAEVDASEARIAEQYESALVIDPARDDVRRQLAEVLYARAELADLLRLAERRDELLRRLALHDETGALEERWRAPAWLELAVEPATASATIARIVPDGHALRPEPARPLATPAELEPGSYLVELSAPGRAPVRYPVLLGRAERYRIEVALPPAEEIPEGFVYVPPGRFLVGSADEALRREFLATVPLHEARTDGFLIAVNETTYAEWIAYLESLPAAERATRPPKIAAGGARGTVGLAEVRGGWQLTFQVSSDPYTARSGEPVRYQGRDRRASGEWRWFPVSGIGADDAEAYTRWLDATGRVPGARLCTDHEWERAARGADAREFPASASLLLPDDANFDETYGKQPRAFGPDEVGAHPASQSLFGVNDLTGNIFEWVVSTLSPDPYAVRGGAFYFGQLTGRSTNRWLPERTLRELTQGVRVCASYPPR